MKVRNLLLVLGAIAAIFILYFVGRNWLLGRIFEREKRYYYQAYGLQINATQLAFTGLSDVQLSGLTVVPKGQDTLATLGEAGFNLSLIKILTGSIGINRLQVKNVFISAYNLGERNNIASLTHPKKLGLSDNQAADSYQERATKWQSELLHLLNTAFNAQEVNLAYYDSNGLTNIYLPDAIYDLQKFSAIAINRTFNDTLRMKGQVLEPNQDYQFEITHKGVDTAWLPFMGHSPGLKCTFQTLSGELKFEQSETWSMQLTLNLSGLRVNHWRLAKDDVLIPETTLSSLIKITDDAVELDSTSGLSLGSARFNLFAYYQRKPDTLIAFNIHMPEVASDTFFNSIPTGMFTALKGISCSGTLAYDLQFSMHTNQLDSLIFLSSLKRKDFHIIHYGIDNLTRIDGNFTYDAYQGARFVRKIEIGPDNPDYTPLDRISHYLPLCIMQSEDPGFMQHKGFIPEAMRESIAQDFKEKRFARGGSTISMQLVKNVFLRRDKTISRKVEEALIVYLVENLQLVSKERMMEVYLNVIEWGPGIYGIGEASQFYFHKSPAQLTLPECVFLAAIIPNPRSFRYQFDKTGHVKSYITDFYKLIAGRLVSHGLISEGDTLGISPHVKLYGPAAQMVLPGDSLPIREEELEPDAE